MTFFIVYNGEEEEFFMGKIEYEVDGFKKKKKINNKKISLKKEKKIYYFFFNFLFLSIV